MYSILHIVHILHIYTKNIAYIVKLSQGSGKDGQGMALKAKGLKA